MNATTEVIDELRRVMAERDEARRARDQYLRERDLALRAEERARESLEELEEAIDDCLPGDDDDDAPIDCVGHAGDKLRDMTRQRDEARADAERYLADLRRCASEPYEHAKERAEAFRRGAEAMREACARSIQDDTRFIKGSRTYLANELRALPIPEEP